MKERNLINIIMSEMRSDGESHDKKAEALERLWVESPDLINDVMIVLCGWSMKTLLVMEEQEAEHAD